jgi:hypothetical protein
MAGGLGVLVTLVIVPASASASTPAALGSGASTSTDAWMKAFTAFGALSQPFASMEPAAHAGVRPAVAASTMDPPNGDVYCYGSAPPVVPHDLIVPATDPSGNPNVCVAIGTQVGHDVIVEPASSSGDGLLAYNIKVDHDVTGGANSVIGLLAGSVGHDAKATDPLAFEIVGDPTTTPATRAQVTHDVRVDGSNQGVILCGTNVNHDVVLDNDFGMIIGDEDAGCDGFGEGVLVAHDFKANDNVGGPTDISDNTPAFGGAVGHDFTALNDQYLTPGSGPVVENNAIGKDATCNPAATTDGPDAPNQVGGNDRGCNAWVGQPPQGP